MDEHRLTAPRKIEYVKFEPPFSSFQYVDTHYRGDNPAIRRLFSLARAHQANILVVEEIDPVGIISEENEDIKDYFPDYENVGLERISFWGSSSTIPAKSTSHENVCLGYAILKHDRVPTSDYDYCHVFEAVFQKYQHRNNCVPNPMEYKVNLDKKITSVKGLLYAQQNELNKACSQVALRSLISRIKKGDISYREINNLAKRVSPEDFVPKNGLNARRIRAVLEGLGIRYLDFDYNQHSPEDRRLFPYQKYIYSGIESGAGALLGFSFSGPGIPVDMHLPGHIIPFYGHTFNKDTWAPDADRFYFRVGEELRYVPSENWTSSFLGHDDNLGANFCVPRLYIPVEQVDYVVELLHPGVKFGGAQAEGVSLQFLYSVLEWINSADSNIDTSENVWLGRLAQNVNNQQIVLRAVATDKDKYIRHLSNARDWDGKSEDAAIIKGLNSFLPNSLWVIEVSIPQLFPANERKIGDIVLNGEIELEGGEKNEASFIFVRLPRFYLFPLSETSGPQEFVNIPSKLESHVDLIRFE